MNLRATRFSLKFWLPFILLFLLLGILGMVLFTLCRPRKLTSRAAVSSQINRPFMPGITSAASAADSLVLVKPVINAHSLTHCTLGQKDWWTRGLTRLRRALALQPAANAITRLTTTALTTEPSGSTLLVCMAMGNISGFTRPPTDNQGNPPYLQLGTTHNYEPQYPNSGTALYGLANAKGGQEHILTTDMIAHDEITLAVVEIKHGGVIQDYKWNAVPKGNPLTSLSVTTTGPATLVAFWWGDGNESIPHRAVPNNGFTVIDSLLSTGLLIQAAVATKEVTQAGSYNVTWDSGGWEGAQLYLVAVQSIPSALLAANSESHQAASPPAHNQ